MPLADGDAAGWRAWLSYEGANPLTGFMTRVNEFQGSFSLMRVDGAYIAASLGSFLSPNDHNYAMNVPPTVPVVPLNCGLNSGTNCHVWSNTNVGGGTAFVFVGAACNGWTNGGSGTFGFVGNGGAAVSSAGAWTDFVTTARCNQTRRLYCVLASPYLDR